MNSTSGNLYIDYSAYSAFDECPWKWYEKYVNKRTAQYVGQRSDALARGTLVHVGLESFHKHGNPTVPQEIVSRINPTFALWQEVQQLLLGYVRWYGSEP